MYVCMYVCMYVKNVKETYFHLIVIRFVDIFMKFSFHPAPFVKFSYLKMNAVLWSKYYIALFHNYNDFTSKENLQITNRYNC